MTAPDETAAPPDPLASALSAYAAGNFAGVRAETANASTSADPEVAKRARDLRARISIDPWIWVVLGACLTLFCVLLVLYAR
jgi:hypothetical protein